MKTALVTGGNRGIGLALCQALAEGGIRVFLGSRNVEDGEKSAKEVGCEFVELDVANEKSVYDAFEFVAKETDALDILINNAGVCPDGGHSGLTTEPGLMGQTFEINTLGAVRVIQAAMPLLRKSPSGRIVNVSSGWGALSEMGGLQLGYRMSKAAMNAMTLSLADELSETNVCINSVCPGWVRTRMGGDSAERTPETAAEGILKIALAEDSPSGGFFRDGEAITW